MHLPPGIDPDATRTDFMPARRAGASTVEAQQQSVASSPELAMLRDLPVMVVLINDTRQIIWTNDKASGTFRENDVIGMRLGEAIGCVHACELPGGCGTSSFCSFCGSPTAIMKALSGFTDSEECVIQRDDMHGADSLDLMMWSKPVTIAGFPFVMLVAQDMSVQKRQEVLERVFYHDIGNTASGIRGILNLIEYEPENQNMYMQLLRSAADQLLEEIDSQRAMKAAEDGSLATDAGPVNIAEAISHAAGSFAYTLFGKKISIALGNPETGDSLPGNVVVHTDAVLLRRIIVNMLKNALEAATPSETIRVWHDSDGMFAYLHVRNAAVMDGQVRKRVFQRSFSTKGRGRGLGTYGMKLLAEHYLGGQVSFSSRQEDGTTFTVRLPLSPPPVV